ncbi:hypothetical protein AHAS_Ahas12G0040400 [Arachis hypogaea]
MLGHFDNSIHMFLRMISCGVSPTQFTFTNVLASCAATEALDIGRKVHSFIVKLGLSSVVPVANLLLNMYAKSGDSVMANVVFDRMSSSSKPDKYTLESVLSACANLENLKLGKQIHAYMVRANIDISGAVRNALILMYAKAGGIKISHRIVDITGYAQNGLLSDALDLFKKMVREGPKPNNYTLAAVLSVFSSLASLGHGNHLHATAIRLQEASSIFVGNALITMYSRSGSIKDAGKVFKQICSNKNKLTWTYMIIALAQHGFGKDAAELFDTMLKLDIEPDQITYVGVLFACSHVGLVQQGKSYFSLMKNVHHIEPTSSHYACMIDLLGRAGLLEEAYHFIKNMPVEPDVIAWGSLLASCRVHKNVDLAKVAPENLLLLDPNNSGAYSALANTLSACRRWKDAAMIRKSMKDRVVKKEQGISWVQIHNKVHIFRVEDRLHPQRDPIYRMISKIWMEIKKMGFIPNTNSVLHDLDQEVKEQILRHHSEKLAIAFALLNTPGYATLRH